MVDLWHFPMMNDVVRNSAYEAALAAALKQGGVVLDIGTGSGLLAMMAVRQGATQVFTCEGDPEIARKATEIIKRNGYADRIQVISGLSTQIHVGNQIPAFADVLVTEIFDDGLLGEGAVATIEDARNRLLKPDAQVIPASVQVKAMCIESMEILNNFRVSHVSGFDLSDFNEFSLGGYVGCHLDKMKYQALSEVKDIFSFDFKRPIQPETKPVDLKIAQAGDFHVIAYWFELQMDNQTSVSSGPGLPELSSWKQAIQIWKHPLRLERGDRCRLVAHHDTTLIWFTSA